PVNSTSSALFATLSNTGNTTLTGITPTIIGTNPGNFALTTGTNACGATLAAGSSCNIYLTFAPTAVQSYSATLQVTDNATPTTQTSALTGTGTGAPAVTLTSALNFPSTYIGTTSAPLSAVLTNTGTAPLSISTIQLGGANTNGFTITTGTNACSANSTLAAGNSCNIYLTFTPSVVITYTASLIVNDNASPAQ